MAIRTFSLTMTGVVQRLSDVYGGVSGVVDPKTDIPYRQLLFQSRDGNAADIYVGDADTVSSTDYGFHVDNPGPPALNPPTVVGPFDQGPLHLSDFWVIGTANDVLHVLGVPF